MVWKSGWVRGAIKVNSVTDKWVTIIGGDLKHHLIRQLTIGQVRRIGNSSRIWKLVRRGNKYGDLYAGSPQENRVIPGQVFDQDWRNLFKTGGRFIHGGNDTDFEFHFETGPHVEFPTVAAVTALAESVVVRRAGLNTDDQELFRRLTIENGGICWCGCRRSLFVDGRFIGHFDHYTGNASKNHWSQMWVVRPEDNWDFENGRRIRSGPHFQVFQEAVKQAKEELAAFD